jgi:hypothetical protein
MAIDLFRRKLGEDVRADAPVNTRPTETKH